MRKKTISFLFDNVLWYFIYFFPLVIIAISSIHSSVTIDIYNFFTVNGYNLLTDSVIYQSLLDLFGESGYLPLFTANSGMLMFCCWFITANIVHLAVDFLLFIPRLAHKWMDDFTKRG